MNKLARAARLLSARQTDLVLRLCGLVLITVPAALIWRLLRGGADRPPRSCGIDDLVIAGIAVAALCLANLLLIAGGDLLLPMPRPPRPVPCYTLKGVPMTDVAWLAVLIGLVALTLAFLALAKRA